MNHLVKVMGNQVVVDIDISGIIEGVRNFAHTPEQNGQRKPKKLAICVNLGVLFSINTYLLEGSTLQR